MTFNFRQQDYVLRFKPGFFALCASVILMFCMLGKWQLHRYHFKKTLLASYQESTIAAPIPLAALLLTKEDLQFKQVAVTGHYLNALTMFVQNQFYHEQLGYEVLTPLQIPGQKELVLVDRGWVKKPAGAELPVIAPVADEQHITGNIKRVSEYQFILGDNILQPAVTPIVMQKVDLKEISKMTQQTFYPFLLRLGANEKNGFVRDWTLSAVNPERHMGYAVQWFLMAIVSGIAYIRFCFERVGSTDNANS